jgi:hypothetical protein
METSVAQDSRTARRVESAATLVLGRLSSASYSYAGRRSTLAGA